MSKHIISIDKVVIILLYWLPLQDFMMGIVYSYTYSSLLANVLLYSKDMMLLLLLFLCFMRKQKNTTLNKFIFFYIIIIILYSLYSFVGADISLAKLVASARGLILCPVFILVGSNITDANGFVRFYKEKYVKYLLILAIIGILDVLLDMTIGTKHFWADVVGIGKMYNNIKGDPNTYMGLPGNFYGYSSLGFFTRKRLCSLWANPLSSAYSFFVPIIYYAMTVFFSKDKHSGKKKNVVILFIFFAAIIMSYTRAIILGMCIGMIILFIYRNKARMSNIVIAFVMALCSIAIFLFAGEINNLYSFLYDGSTKGHIDALISNIEKIGLFGVGVGNFGATESVYFSVWGQIGIIGLLMFSMISYTAIKNSFENIVIYGEFSIVVAVAWIVFMITALISEQLTAFTTIAPSYVLLGVVQQRKKEKLCETIKR